MHMGWDDLQTVEAVVRLGNVEAAARELALRHSSVSRRITALEVRLGTALFARGRRLVPTGLALRLAERAAAMRSHATEAQALLAAANRHRAGRQVITTNDVLAPLLFAALARVPSPRAVDVLVSDSELALVPGQVDLALRPSPDPGGALRGRRLGFLRLGVFRARAAPQRWVLPSASLRARKTMRWWKHVPADVDGHLVCNSLLGIRDACRAGLGAALLPCFLVQPQDGLHLDREVDGGPPVWLLAPPGPTPADAKAAQRDLFVALRGIPGAFRRA